MRGPVLEYPKICSNEDDLKSKLRIFIRDMAIQGKKVTFHRVGRLVLCPETGHQWSILGSSTNSEE
jgi:hypothetical protein